MRALRRHHRIAALAPDRPTDANPAASVDRIDGASPSPDVCPPAGAEYQALRAYYLRMLALADVLHFNSSMTREIYRRYMDTRHGFVAPVTHAGMGDHKRRKEAVRGALQVVYLGPMSAAKGFYACLEALDAAYAGGEHDFTLHVFGASATPRPYVRVHPAYRPVELGGILETADLVVVPSQAYDTFGLVVAEALSYGVPVVVTDRVGAKDLVRPGEYGWVLPADGLPAFFARHWPDRATLAHMNQRIFEDYPVLIMGEHARVFLEPETGWYRRYLPWA